MRYYDYPTYVSVGERRAKAEKKLQQLRKTHPNITPMIIEGRTLATTWWGKSWNSNLERYADYSNRIGRGRSYVRHRAVLDLQLAPGHITALVQGSSAQPYKVVITVDTLSADTWATIRTACAGCFDSLSELLAGAFPQALKDLFFAKGAGLFPSPRDIHFDCSCPDWALMCKHVAAALYGVGARLDAAPSLFFTLRGINIDDIITQTVDATAQTLLRKAQRQSANVLEDVDLGEVFGIQLDDIATPLPDRPSRQPQPSTPTQNATTTRQTMVGTQSMHAGQQRETTRLITSQKQTLAAVQADTASARVGQRLHNNATTAPPAMPKGTMLDAVVNALGKTRKGKSLEQLQEKLRWTKIQVRNALSRAGAKGLVETIRPGVYRQKV